MKQNRWARSLRCSETDEIAPLDRQAALSSVGAPWLVDYALDPSLGESWRDALLNRPWSLWRYHELLPMRSLEDVVDLGEGGTPLVRLQRATPPGLRVWLKQEGANPSGSFKDRGLSLAVNRARELGAPGVTLASAGNAALALCAYAAASGLPAKVAMPADTPRIILQRCRAYGAEVLTSPGTLVEAAARLTERDDGYWTLSTFREPYRVEGKKTMGLELVEQFGWSLPDWIVYPTGGGTGIVAMQKAFDELEALGLISGPRPRFAVVQMAGCAPVVRAFEEGVPAATPWQDPKTEAWGLRVPRSLGDRMVLRALAATDGAAVAVNEAELTPMRARIAREEGHLVGPEGAACLVAVETLARAGTIASGADVVVFQTGHPANYGLD